MTEPSGEIALAREIGVAAVDERVAELAEPVGPGRHDLVLGFLRLGHRAAVEREQVVRHRSSLLGAGDAADEYRGQRTE